MEVTKAKPVTRTITSANIDRLRVTFGVQSLLETTSKGDRNPSSVRLLIQLQRNGNWVTEKDVTINGKTTSQYLASVILDNLPPRPFNIRMVRETADSTTDQLQNKTLWSSYTEIIDVKQCYPNTAIVGLQVDAEQFGGQQMTVNYHIRGRIIQVPSNYDPEKRTYSGIWDGSLKPAYSNNPAWCLWDMLTHPRYGMGKRLGAADVDKWALYAIGQYCDQTVPDGFGGTEPRMTFNAYLSQQRKAWDVLSDFCSAMRCMPVWNGQTLTFVQDRPSDVVWPYTNSDVVVDDNGVGFRYSFSALKDRHTAVEVNYTDPQNGWQTSTELVEDPEAILRYGRNLLKMDAFGCTSRGQAHRAGLWVIKTGLLETQTVDFTLGSQGLRHTPGDIIEICDNDYAGTMTGGRVLSIDAASRTLTLDREVTLPETGAATVNLINGSGKPVSVAITAHPAPDRIQVSTLPDGVETYGVWGLSLPSLRRRLFRCVSIRENTDGTFAITAVQHLTVEVSAADGQYLAQAKWDTPRVVKGVRFSLRLTSGSGEDSRLVTTAITADTAHRFSGLPLGEYTLTVRAINSYGQQGEPATTTFRINAPAVPATIELTPGYFQITATPHLAVYDPTVQFEFWFSETRITDIRQVETTARYLGTGLYWIAASINIKPGHDYYFYIRSVNTVGKSAFVEAVGQPSDDASGYLDFFKGEIGKTHLAQELWTQIDNGQLAPDLTEIRTSITDVSNEITQTVNKKLEDQSAAIQQIQKVQVDTNNNLNSMWAVKLQQMQDGRLYIAGIGAGIENTPDGMQSQVLLAADRIAMINPANGNTKPMFVGQGDQIFMNEVFLKYLTAPTITSGGNPPAFSLTPDGRLTAKNADISGSVNANSGALNNVTINQNCTIKGMLEATQVRGDFVKAVSKAFPKKVGTWGNTETPNGTVTVTISDDHNFDRQIIIPPIIFNGIAYDDPGSGNNPGGTRYTGYGFEVRKNGVLIASRETKGAIPGSYSAVIDMPSGGGSVTLEFKIFQKGNQGAGNITDCTVIVTKKAASGISIR
ncbi:host specificity protein J [Escherichia coli]|nr:host specificity protein J [Escherichia coli]EFC4103069.1 host specificity protein J [Escherichia coli]EFL4399759.1 host specificity protein J [Escherichia coli]EFQ6267575.1 host specificity protein J [Escherichia coli]EGD0463739.1 host specificity protein J [Escherichia coli]